MSFLMENNSPGTGFFAIQLIHHIGDGHQRVEFFASDPLFAENAIFEEGDRSTENGKVYDTDDGIFFSSQTFQNNQRTFDLFVETQYLSADNGLELRILTLSPELYHYLTAYQRQESVANNPFAEPVQVFSNINGGFGIFGGYSTSVINLD